MTVLIKIPTFNLQDQTVEDSNTSTCHVTRTRRICVSVWINVCDMAALSISSQLRGQMAASSRQEVQPVTTCVQESSNTKDPWGTDGFSPFDHPNHNNLNLYYGIYPQLVEKHGRVPLPAVVTWEWWVSRPIAGLRCVESQKVLMVLLTGQSRLWTMEMEENARNWTKPTKREQELMEVNVWKS